MDVRKHLKHTCQHTSVTSKSAYGETQATSITTVACLVYYQSTKREHEDHSVASPPGWNGIVPTSLAVSIGDLLVSVVDKGGNTIMATGTVTRLEKYHHPTQGTVLQQVELGID